MIKIGDEVMCIKDLNKTYITFKKSEIYEICDILHGRIYVYSSDKQQYRSFGKKPSFYTYFTEKIED